MIIINKNGELELNSLWGIDDVLERDDEGTLTREQASRVLSLMDKYHDANVGINWEVIDYWIDEVRDNNELG